MEVKPKRKTAMSNSSKTYISELKTDVGKKAVLFPQDAHMPKCQIDGPTSVHKVVVKVKING
jgi:YhcH/YjgK/YiaL family protein